MDESQNNWVVSLWIYRVATGAIERARRGQRSMPGNPLIIRHLGQKGFYLLSSNPNGKPKHRCGRQETEEAAKLSAPLANPTQAEVSKVTVGENKHSGEVKLGSSSLLRIYCGLNLEETDKSGMAPAFRSPLFNRGEERPSTTQWGLKTAPWH